MSRIATYVFLDLETTSIPKQELNKTRIVELSMVALKRRHMLDTRAGTMPRVQHKLTMCFSPGRPIDPGATEASGLDNFALEYETTFNISVFNTINSFIGCLEKPVCFISENGHNFDFPILKNHFERLKVQLTDDILCADSLDAFYDILKPLDSGVEKVDGNASGVASQKFQNTANCLTQIEINEVSSEKNNLDNIDASVNLSLQNRGGEELKENKIADIKLDSPLSMQLQNETTPKSRQSHKKIIPAKKINKARRKIFYQGDKKPIIKYRLKDIYERVLGRPAVDAHRAENDCIMAAEISIAKINEFVEWVDSNHCYFSEVKPMTPGVPLGY